MEFREHSLNGEWRLREAPLSMGAGDYGRVMFLDEGWIPTPVPGDVHQGLIAAGKMPEPLLGLNSLQCLWVEDRSWWYEKAFATKTEWLEADVVELELSGLDVMADVFLNGVHLGMHPSAFRPFVHDIRGLLRPHGDNLLVVRLTTGSDRYGRADIASVSKWVSGDPGPDNRAEKSRAYLRKPQYTFGWDWSPRVPTCGITGGVVIRPMGTVAIPDIRTEVTLAEGRATVGITAEVRNLDFIGTTEALVSVRVTGPNGFSHDSTEEVVLCSGFNEVSFTITVDDPELWWPNGMGGQPLYTVEGTVRAEGTVAHFGPRNFGLRTVGIDQSRLEDGNRLFAIVVNGVRVYCKGANWIPADAVYARVTPETYGLLVDEAAEANFNMLRVWGGGLYEPDCFYDACDRAGILVWHDFMFACSAYPDHEEWFADEVRKEAEYQVARLRNHPCLALWCGSNENLWALVDWYGLQTKGGARTYNEILPRVVRALSPGTPYWNSSPYGGKSPNSPANGDTHHWGDCMMNAIMEKRITPEEYDLVDPRFVSEYGYVGPCGIETTRQYLDGEPFDRSGKAWQHHNNTFEKDTVVAGIRKHYGDPEGMSVDDYLLYAGLCQGLMYEYSLDSFRGRPNCHGGLFWMYGDCWGEVGWTIIDYYRRRKIAYNHVRRANGHRRVILRRRDDRLRITGANDTPEALTGILEYGYVGFDGSGRDTRTTAVAIPAFTRSLLADMDLPAEWDTARGVAFAVLRSGSDEIRGIMRSGDFKGLECPEAHPRAKRVGEGTWEVTSDTFAHAVHFGLPGDVRVSDEYFDLLPGETRRVRVTGPGVDGLELVPKAVRPVQAD